MDDAAVKKTLEAALIAVLNLKYEYISVQDFDNATKWQDIADVLKKANLMAVRPVRIEPNNPK